MAKQFIGIIGITFLLSVYLYLSIGDAEDSSDGAIPNLCKLYGEN